MFYGVFASFFACIAGFGFVALLLSSLAIFFSSLVWSIYYLFSSLTFNILNFTEATIDEAKAPEDRSLKAKDFSADSHPMSDVIPMPERLIRVISKKGASHGC